MEGQPLHSRGLRRAVNPWTYGNSGNSGMLSSPPPFRRVRARRVVLTPVVVHAIDAALDAVFADATVVVTARQDARASVDDEVPLPVVLRRLTRVRVPSSAQRRRVG
jgi:hypothetical protein